MSILGDRLRKARKNKDLTQEDVAKLLGTTYQTISNYERGTRDPDTETLNRLAGILDVSVDWLLGNTDDPTPPKTKPPEPDYRAMVFTAKTAGDAYERSVAVQAEYRLGKDWLYQIWKEIAEAYPLRPAAPGSRAAHDTNYPGSSSGDDDR